VYSTLVQGLIALARRNLQRRPLRSGLTVIGVALGAAAYALLVASGEGLKEELNGIMTHQGSEVIVQRAGVAMPDFSQLTPGEVQALRRLRGVRGLSVLALYAIQLQDHSQMLVLGLDPEESTIGTFKIVSGRKLGRGGDEMIVGRSAARRLHLAPGDRAELVGRRQFRVVGVFESGSALTETSAVIDVRVAQRVFGLGENVTLALLDLDAGASPDDVIAEVESTLPALEAHKSATWASSFRQIETVERFARFLGFVALVVAAGGVATAMTVSVTERVHELGVLRAVGWRPGRVARLVLTEALVITALGAAAGLGAAWLVLQATKSVLSSWSFWLYSGGLRGTVVIESLLLPVAAGLVGCVPALAQVLRLKPGQALRPLG
jgi:ABC-type lipoprotein release transport system permease subunit